MTNAPIIRFGSASWFWLGFVSLLLVALCCGQNASAITTQQQSNLEQITQDSQQSYTLTEAKILAELKTNADPDYRLQLLIKQAQLYDLYQRYELLLSVAKEGQVLAQTLKQDSSQLLFNIMEANALNLIGKSYEALRIHQGAASQLQGSKPEVRYFGILSLANAHMALNQNELATKELNSIVNATDAPPMLKSKASLALAELQMNILQYAKSLEYYRKALEISPASMHQLMLTAEMGIAQALNGLKKHQEAILKIDKVIHDFHQSGNLNAEAYALLLRGYFYSKSRQFWHAEPSYLQSAALYEKLGNPQKLSNIYTHLSGHYTDLKDIDKALEYGEKTLALALNSSNLGLQWDAYATLAEARAAEGNHKLAYQHMRKAFATLLESSKQTLESQTILMREQFDAERKEKENTILAEKLAIDGLILSSKKREIWILSILVIVMTISLVALLRAYRSTRYLAQHDGLTGLLNRRQVLRQGEQEFERAKRYHTPLSIVSFDIDHFKEINDEFGHAEGDKVLKCVGNICKDVVRGSDFVGRLGGEEFLIVLSHSEKEGALKFAERVRERLSQDVNHHLRCTVTASFGVVQMSANDTDFESLLQRADIAMYHAKSHGRNQCSTVDLQIVSSA